MVMFSFCSRVNIGLGRRQYNRCPLGSAHQFQDWSGCKDKSIHLGLISAARLRGWEDNRQANRRFGTTVFGKRGNGMDPEHAGSGHHKSTGTRVASHEMDRELGPVDQSLVADVRTGSVRPRRNPGRAISDPVSHPSKGKLKHRLRLVTHSVLPRCW